MNAEDKQVKNALVGSFDDYDVAGGACMQSATEIDVILQAIFNGASDSIVCMALQGIAERLRAAARLAKAIDEADEKPEAAL